MFCMYAIILVLVVQLYAVCYNILFILTHPKDNNPAGLKSVDHGGHKSIDMICSPKTLSVWAM